MRTHHRAQLGGPQGSARRSSTARVLHLLMANLDITDAELAERLHTSRQTINSRRKGRVAMTAEDLGELAQVLGVDVRLFFGTPHQAVQWLVDNRADDLDEEPVLSKRFVAKGCTASKLSRSLSGAKILVRPLPGGIRAAA